MSITGKGTVATGRIERGMAKTGDTIEIVGVKEMDPRGSCYSRVIVDVYDIPRGDM